MIARRSVERGAKVTLVEAGPGLPLPVGLRALDLGLHRPPERLWPGLDGSPATSTAPYVQGFGLGGSGAVNGGVLAMPTADELSRWSVASGCADWSPEGFEAAARRAVDGLGSTCEPDSSGDAALASLFPSLGAMNGANTLSGRSVGLLHPVLAAGVPGGTDSLTRVLIAERLVKRSGDLEILTGTPVDRLIAEDGVGCGVILADGRVVRAEQVVLACGAIQTPLLMARSGLLSQEAFEAFDHASVGISFRWPADVPDVGRGRQALVRLVGRWTPAPIVGSGSMTGEATLHVIGPFVSGGSRLQPASGLALVAPVVEATRSIVADGSRPGSTAVGPCRWEDEVAARAAATVRAAVVELSQALAGAGGEPAVENKAPGLDQRLFDDPRAVLAWMNRHCGPTYHVAGTLHRANAMDPAAIGRLRAVREVAIADASVLPGLPAIGPQLAVMAVAETVANGLW